LNARVLVLEAGSAAGNNLIRSLQAGDPSLTIVGCNESRFILKKSAAERNYLLPVGSDPYLAALRRIVESEQIDLLIPTSDPDVRRISGLRRKLGCRTFLPGKSVIERCQDKYALTTLLRRRGIPAPLTYAIRDSAEVPALFRRFAPRARLWCRVRAGAGSYGAIPVKSPEQAQSWIAYWEQMRAVPPGSFTLSEYLPGRDFCVQCLWDKGTLVLAKMAERITYLDTGSPSGVSSMPALAKTAYDPRIVAVCARAVRALDARASGVYFIDIKESDDGRPCITEINAGRFATMTNIHDLVGRHNMAVTYVRIALGERVRIPKAADFAEGYYLVRSVDTLPVVVRKDELFRGIEDASV
jgi:glutathione synthase/RimK-type ligase-like ATP-grasp enzyme